MKNIKDIPKQHRENIGMNDMRGYENNGICIDELYENGFSVYMSYGQGTEVFKALNKAIFLMEDEVRALKESINTFSKENYSEKISKESIEEIILDKETRISELKLYIELFDNIFNLKNKM